MQCTLKLTANQIPRSNNKIMIAYDIETVLNRITWWIKFQQTLKRYTALTPVNKHLSEIPRSHASTNLEIAFRWTNRYHTPVNNSFWRPSASSVQEKSSVNNEYSKRKLAKYVEIVLSCPEGRSIRVFLQWWWDECIYRTSKHWLKELRRVQWISISAIEQACKKNYSELGKNGTNSVSHMQ